MNYPFIKAAAVLGVAATMMASVADPAAARNRWVGPAVGFGAGVVVGSAIANSHRPYYYGNRYNAYGAYADGPYYGGRVYVQPAYPQYYPHYRKCDESNAGRLDQGC